MLSDLQLALLYPFVFFFTALSKIEDFTKGNFRDAETKSHYQYLNWKATNFLDGKVFTLLEDK